MSDLRDDSPDKPTQVESRLYDAGLIESISVTYEMTGPDTANELLVLNKKHRFDWNIWELLEVKPSFPRSIARLKPSVVKKVEMYRDWLRKEKRDLATYRRLKQKFGGPLKENSDE